MKISNWSSGWTNFVELYILTSTFNYKFNFGSGQTFFKIPTSPSPVRCMPILFCIRINIERYNIIQHLKVFELKFPDGFFVPKKQKKISHTTCGLLLCWQTNIFSSFCSLSAFVWAEEYKWALVVIFIISFSIGCGSGLDIIKYQHSSKPCSLCVMPVRHTLNNYTCEKFIFFSS